MVNASTGIVSLDIITGITIVSGVQPVLSAIQILLPVAGVFVGVDVGVCVGVGVNVGVLVGV